MAVTTFDALILGFVQGLTEFIPVSSSGHLIIGANLLGIEGNSFFFDVSLNMGTLLALIIYFHRELMDLMRLGRTQNRYILAMIISTIPAVLLGVFLQPIFEAHERSVLLVIVMLSIVGFAMLFIDNLATLDKKLPPSKYDALFIGVAQAAALIPGVSRSGATIIGARLRGFSPERAARYSFMIAIPVITGATLRVLMSGESAQLIRENLGIVIVGNVASAIGGFVAISFMLRILQRKGLFYFGVYRLVLAILLSLLLMNGSLSL